MIQHASCYPVHGMMHSLSHVLAGDHHHSSSVHGHGHMNTVAVAHDMSDHVHVVERPIGHHRVGYGEYDNHQMHMQGGYGYGYGDGYNTGHGISNIHTHQVYETPTHHQSHYY
ncbi:Hypothetical protein CINCED_3A023081 [Cinara cedri]|uniref:Uncharacterized protein n=2 Tax=Cinara cedri TaxID=506608 RepID=A0A5E4MG70_9HEMI|nr:Hypothetical protein CINCED_3A023081 [Cinara cedri]